VSEALDQPHGEFSQAELLRLEKLQGRGRRISQLDGIEQLRNLTVLDLADNRVVDISPLKELTRLVLLDLESNQVVDISPLANLQDLEALVLDQNAIADISPLLGLSKLRNVELSGNPLDASSLRQHLPALRARGVEAVFRAVQSVTESLLDLAGKINVVFIGKSRNAWWDIYMLRAGKAGTLNLTDGPARYHGLRVSPDGSKILFSSDWDDGWRLKERFFVMDLTTGSLQALYDRRGYYSAWSPDGARIAFCTSGPRTESGRRNESILLVDADGTRLVDLVQQSEWDINTPMWSPDGTRIAFHRLHGRRMGAVTLVSSDLYVIEADGARVRPLAAEEGMSERALCWLPHGEDLVFRRCKDRPPWAGEGPPDRPPLECGMYRVDVNGGPIVSLPDWPLPSWSDPSWSPDGTRVALATGHGASAATDIYVMDADGRNARNLTPSLHSECHSPTWLTDDAIAFWSEGAMYIVSSAGGDAILVVNKDPALNISSGNVWLSE